MKKIISFCLALLLVAGTAGVLPRLQNHSGSDVYAATAIKSPTNFKVRKASDTSLKLTWTKAAGANGYTLYRYNKSTKTYQIIENIRRGSKVSYVDSGLKKDTIYRYKIRSYKKSGGTRLYSKRSYWISAITYHKNATTVNVGDVKLISKSKVTVKKGAAKTAKAKISPTSKSNAKNKKVYNNDIRWSTSNAAIATIDQNGKIKGIKKGTCKVYAKAHNGNTKAVSVTVKPNYAKPSKFINLSKLDSKTSDLLKKYKSQITDIAEYLETVDGEYYIQIEKGTAVARNSDTGKKVTLKSSMTKKITSFLKSSGMDIERTEGNGMLIQFGLDLNTKYDNINYIGRKIKSSEKSRYGEISLASDGGWYYKSE